MAFRAQAIGEMTGTYLSAKAKAGGSGTKTATSGVSAATRRQVSSLFAEAKKIYEPGGGYMAGTEAGIARGSKRAVASGMQQLASAGLAGTSIVGGLGKKYEEEIGMPTRQAANIARLSALSGLLQAEAGATASLATRYSTSPGATYGGGGGGGRGTAPRVSTRRAPAAPQAQVQPLPTLNLPSITTKKEPTGYQGIFYGAAYYKKQQPKAAPVSKPGSYYDVGGELGI